jgi:hypothetical protein
MKMHPEAKSARDGFSTTHPTSAHSGKAKRIGQTPPPPGCQRHLAHGRAVMGVDHRALAARDRGMFGDEAVAPAKQQHIASAEVIHCNGHEMTQRRLRQRLLSPRLGPVRRIRRRCFRLIANAMTPDAAHEAEAVASDMLTAPQAPSFCYRPIDDVRDFRFIPRIIRKIFRMLKHSFCAFGNALSNHASSACRHRHACRCMLTFPRDSCK